MAHEKYKKSILTPPFFLLGAQTCRPSNCSSTYVCVFAGRLPTGHTSPVTGDNLSVATSFLFLFSAGASVPQQRLWENNIPQTLFKSSTKRGTCLLGCRSHFLGIRPHKRYCFLSTLQGYFLFADLHFHLYCCFDLYLFHCSGNSV